MTNENLQILITVINSSIYKLETEIYKNLQEQHIYNIYIMTWFTAML